MAPVSIPSSRVGTHLPKTFSTQPQHVSIPSSRVGTRSAQKSLVRSRQFPSPQVGSELIANPAILRTFPRFHPLKSGRNRISQFFERVSVRFPSPQVGSEHGLKVRDGDGVVFVSIPSSRVGTKASPLETPKQPSFHPLKSGRNISQTRRSQTTANVSIPSSRVGTGAPPRVSIIDGKSFHPLKSGRNIIAKGEQR